MTREQAIMVLNMVDAYGVADEAKRMAIEALKAQPANGQIINADKLKNLLEKRKQFFINANGSFHNMSEKDKARCDEIDTCIALITNMRVENQ